MKPNRLITEKSPYLLQHAHNPVAWYPWGKEAFDRAAAEDKPVFLSIGYSTCHWCHVMERESFEDGEVAALMNDAFIPVKVDREERPDIDTVYMPAAQLIAGSGGWPLTVVMTPDRRPFFAGTYFPRRSVPGRIGMLELIPRIKTIWNNNRAEVLKFADEVTARLRYSEETPPEEPDRVIFGQALEQLTHLFDPLAGGFSPAPKFPTPHIVLFLLGYAERRGDADALGMAVRTLDAMQCGGIYDHVGYGFHRYSTDQHWLVPHFEKMLYDQAMLCLAYTEAYRITGNSSFRKTSEETLAYLLRDMTSPYGGFYAAEDADSEGTEGKFYVWTYDEIAAALPREEAEAICSIFNVRPEGNFSEHPAGAPDRRNILHRSWPPDEPESRAESDEPARRRLFDVRELRRRPFRDDKILTDWNGLMIAALARAAEVFGTREYAAAAARAADFILQRLCTADGRLLHRYCDGEASLTAYADDYAFFISGLIGLYETLSEARYLQEALRLNSLFLKHYGDAGRGGFFLTADDGEKLLFRSKERYDGAIPSANSMALLNLYRLARITEDSGLAERAAAAAGAHYPEAKKAPAASAFFLYALDFGLGGALRE